MFAVSAIALYWSSFYKAYDFNALFLFTNWSMVCAPLRFIPG